MPNGKRIRSDLKWLKEFLKINLSTKIKLKI